MEAEANEQVQHPAEMDTYNETAVLSQKQGVETLACSSGSPVPGHLGYMTKKYVRQEAGPRDISYRTNTI
jgi:hypothetical protein